MEELQAELEREKKRRREAEKAAEEAEKRADELTALQKGEFYAPFTSLWKIGPCTFTEDDLDALKRAKIPNFPVRSGTAGGSPLYVYTLTAKEAVNPNTVVKDDGHSARTSHSGTAVRESIWPCDVFCNNCEAVQTFSDEEAAQILRDVAEFPENSDFMSPDGETEKNTEEEKAAAEPRTATARTKPQGDIAHLVPASPLQATLYYNVARWVFGFPQGTPMEAIQKTIHGCRKKNESARIKGVGLKHFACNKIRLQGQGAYFDRSPCLIIVPTLPIERILGWSGDGYDAIALIGTRKGETDLGTVARSIGFIEKGDQANEIEIDTARQNLVVALKALAASLRTKPSTGLTETHKKELEKFENVLARIDANKGFVAPTKRNTSEQRPVRKISFVSQTDCNGHPAPDPILLLIKSSINWSKHHDQQLMAGGEIDSDDEVSESSMLAEELWLEYRQAAEREKFHQEILGQTINVVESSQQ